MLKKNNRLKSKSAFNATYKNNCILKSDLVVLYAGKRKENKDYPTRVGFVVSKKIHKRAIRRNRIKRLIRENIRLALKNNSDSIINQFQSLIFAPRFDISEKTYVEINNSMLTLLNKLSQISK